MKKEIMLGIVAMAGFTFATNVPASAKSQVKVYSTHKIAKKAYHGRSGYIYTSNKLTKTAYKLKNYKYTTWYATKWSNVKYKGKFSHVTYITAGSKHGWIYSKYLKAGKAPINKQKRLDDTYTAFKRALMSASAKRQSVLGWASDSYYDMGDSISSGLWEYSDTVSDAQKDKTAILKMYQIFKGRFSKSQESNLETMADDISKQHISEATLELAQEKMNTFGDALGELVSNLS